MPAACRGGNMTTVLQNGAGTSGSEGLVARREPRALIAILSAAKRNAVIACFSNSGLVKERGAWHGLPGGKPIAGVTVADLARDGLLTVSASRVGAAELTDRGNWFARTLLEERQSPMYPT